jgi:two-component system cell cycle response regulator DivK
MNSLKKVLIVEDHSLNLKLFRDILRAKGYSPLEDRTGRDAEKLAERHQPQLIILDVILPHRSGVELVESLKSKVATKNIPIIAVTALAVTEIHQKLLSLGCVSCLIKPFSLDVFLKAVDQAIKSRTINNEVRHQRGFQETALPYPLLQRAG